MRAHSVLATLLVTTMVLPLTGCVGMPPLSDIANQAEDFASQAQELADTLSNVDWGKVCRLVVKDAQTGEDIREVTDQTEIESAFEPFSGEGGIATEPEEPAEYIFELWEPETQKLGQSADDLKEYKAPSDLSSISRHRQPRTHCAHSRYSARRVVVQDGRPYT